ncbi:helicase domain protein [Nitzschia inconspicua]|uniref:Helicase domain protein n=1 Tax=Nitzschia inconspicua TaxID=303405 RepID=A0A9K3KCY4_9STRA|nr:helicase domain protein [Nitzschia inconspicua]KAG7367807.1 helicase domain protein [Nitzschia inconspicua]
MMFTMNSSIDDSRRTTSACADFIDLLKQKQSTSNESRDTTSNILKNAFTEGNYYESGDLNIPSFECFDTSISAKSAAVTTTNRVSTHYQGSDIETILACLEPNPISGIIQRVPELPLSSCLSQDLLKNCNDYCMALQPLDTKQVSSTTSSNSGWKSNRNSMLSYAALNIPCPVSGVSRMYSDSSKMSASSTVTSEVVHIYDYQQERWMDRYQQLSTFFQEHGHSDVSHEFDSNLSGWVRRQRHQFKRAKQGRRSTLTTSRVQLLEQVGFKWDFHDLAWNKNFERLQAFYNVHKHCNVPTSSCSTFFGSKEDNDRLLNWCKRQKRAIRMYLKNKAAAGSRMNAKRFAQLQSIGFRWEPVKSSDASATPWIK